MSILFTPIPYTLIGIVTLFLAFIFFMKLNKGSDGFWPFSGALLCAIIWPLAYLAFVSIFAMLALLQIMVSTYHKLFSEE